MYLPNSIIKNYRWGGFEYNDPREISAMSERSTAFVNTVDDTSSTEAERQLVKIDEAVEYTPPIVPGYPNYVNVELKRELWAKNGTLCPISQSLSY